MADSRYALPNQNIVEQVKENAKKNVESYTDLAECLANMGNRKKVNPKTGRIRVRTRYVAKDEFEYEKKEID